MRLHLPFVLFALMPAALPGQTVRLPATAIVDSPVPWRVDGLRPGTRVDVSIESVTAQGRVATSDTAFVVAADGAIDPARDAPVAGYAGVDPAGPFWSMAPQRGLRDEAGRGRLTLRVCEGGRLLARGVARLADAPADVRFEEVAAFAGARLYRPADTRRRSVVILLGGSEGGAGFGRSLAPHLAALGYAVLALPYYNAGWGEPSIAGLPTAFADIPVDRLAAVHRWLRARRDIDAGAIGLYGVSKGGEFAMLAATRFRWLRAVIGIVPSDVVWEGWGTGDRDGTRASFAWHGRPLPFTPYGGMGAALAAMGRGQRMSLSIPHLDGRRAAPDRAAAARIPVERYAGPMLIAGGDADTVWPSGEMVRAMAERRAAAGRVTVALGFAQAGHGLSGTGWAPLNYPGLEAQAPANARAQRAVWTATVSFLRRYLPVR